MQFFDGICHFLILQSDEPDTRHRPSNETDKLVTLFEWPTNSGFELISVEVKSSISLYSLV